MPFGYAGMRATREVQGLNCPLQPLRACLRHHSLKIEQPTTDPNDRLDCGICVNSVNACRGDPGEGMNGRCAPMIYMPMSK